MARVTLYSHGQGADGFIAADQTFSGIVLQADSEPLPRPPALSPQRSLGSQAQSTQEPASMYQRNAPPVAASPSAKPVQASAPTYQGDVSYWGKAAMSDDYFEEGSNHGSNGQQSFSSGLSPRDAHPRARSWDEDEGYRVAFCPLFIMAWQAWQVIA